VTSDFPILNKEFRKFESLDIWKLLRDGHSRLLPWYLAVSTNRMPAKYLISKSISCNIANLRLASEEELWEEHGELMETFLKIWTEVRSGDLDIISDLAWQQKQQRTSLMDLNVELVNRMLTHCNFCRWNCRVDRSIHKVGDGALKTNKHGTCQLESASKVSSYFHHRGEELVFRGNMGSGTIFFTISY
jgi:putative pyruvate formate lyase activating enzyme